MYWFITLSSPNFQTQPQKRKLIAHAGAINLWPNGVVIWKFDPEYPFTADEEQGIRAVMEMYERTTCIRFKEIGEFRMNFQQNKKIITINEIVDEC